MKDHNALKIFWKFRARSSHDGKFTNYLIYTLPEDRFEEALEFMVQFFLPDETVCESKNVCGDQRSVEIAKLAWMECLNHKCSLICVKEDSNELVGLNLLKLGTDGDQDELYKMNCGRLNDALSVLKIAGEFHNFYKIHQTDTILKCLGLVVHRDYRKRGIATEMFKARIPLMRSLDISLTSAECTGLGSQIACMRAGYQVNYILFYKDIQTYQKGLTFPNIKHDCIKIMSYKV